MKVWRNKNWSLTVVFYAIFTLFPIYWLLVLGLQPNAINTQGLSLWPTQVTFDNFRVSFVDPTWARGYLNATAYVLVNVGITLIVAIPAAYAFSRLRFTGDKHLFFWLLVCRMVPPAVVMVPMVQIASLFQVIDTYIAVAVAHCLFNVPIAIWILEGFLSGIPKEVDEMAKADGYSTLGFWLKILLPQILPGVGVAAFFCFIFSWVELTLANALTTIDAKPIGVILKLVASPLGGVNIGIAAAASLLTILPGVIVAWLLRHHIARGFSMGQIK
ncbi:MAG: carbohydrate ABC transporter permease [Pseudomonadales bacterium]